MQLLQLFPIASTTVLLTVWQPIRLNFPVTSSILPSVAQTSDERTPQLASPIQLAQTNWERKPVMAQAQPLQEREGDGRDRNFQTSVEQFHKGQLREALATLEQVRAQSRDSGDKLGEAEALSGIGEVYFFSLKPTTEALKVLQEAMAIYQEIKDTPQIQFRRSQGQARTLTLTGLAYSQLNQKDKALKYMQKALLIQRLVKDKEGEGKTLNYIASLNIADYTHTDPNRLKQALETIQQALAINREVGNSSNETISLLLLGWGQNRLGDNTQALKLLNEALTKSRENGYRLWEGQALVLITLIYNTQGNPQQALASGQQALSILEAIGSNWTDDALLLLGAIYQNQKQYSEALQSYQQVLTLARQTNNRTGEFESLLNIGWIYSSQGHELLNASSSQQALAAFQKQLESFQAGLTIAQELDNPELKKFALQGIARAYNNMGYAYSALSQYADAIASVQQSLSFAQQAGDREAEFQAWINLLTNHYALGAQLGEADKFQQALETFQQGLKYGQQVLAQAGDDAKRRRVLSSLRILYRGIARLYSDQGQYLKAIEARQQVLALDQQLSDRASEALTLSSIATAHSRLGQFRQALEFQRQALIIVRELQEPSEEVAALISIGRTYDDLGQYSEARDHYQQALALTRQKGALIDQAQILNNLGSIDDAQGQYAQALDRYKQALQLNREARRRLPTEPPNNLARLCSIGTSNGTSSLPADLAKEAIENQRKDCLQLTQVIEVATLNNIASIYDNQGRYQEALENYQQSLAIARALEDRGREATLLSNIGSVYEHQGAYRKALESYQQALEIRKAITDKAGIRNSLNNIGAVSANLGHYQQALSYYQQALSIVQELEQPAQEATALSNLGSTHSYLANYDEALKFLQQSLEIRQKIGDRPGEMYTRSNMGSVHQLQGRYAQAISNYQQALTIAKEIGDRRAQAGAINNLGSVYNDQGNYPQAMSYHQQALEIRSNIGDRAGQVNSLINIGSIHSAQGRYPEAFKVSQQALTLAKELGIRAGEATALNNIGAVYALQGNFAESIRYYEQALAIKREIGDRSGEAIALRGIAINHSDQGEYAKALELLQQALSISQSIGDKAEVANHLNSIGALYSRLGQYPQALKERERALSIAREIGARPQEVNIVGSMGVTYRLQKDYAKALEQYRQSLALAREIGSRSSEGYALSNLGYVYERQGNPAQALESLQQALAIFQNTGDRYGEAFALGGLGLTYQASGRDAEALKTYQQAIAIQQEIGDKAGVGSTLTYLGKLYNSKGQYFEAENSLFQAVEMWETLRGSELSDENKISLFETQADTYRYLQQSLIAQNKTDAALEAAERGRARAFVELLTKQASKPNIPLETKPPSLQQIQQIAQQQKATIIEYSIIPEQSLYIWVISPNGKVTFRSFDLKSLGVGATTEGESLQKLVAETLESLGVGEDRNGIFEVTLTNPAADPELQTKSLKQFHQLLIQPIADLLPSNPEERVIFIPHEDLFRVPFPALMDSEGKYLVEKHTILTAPSIQVLDLTYKQRPNGSRSGQGALVVGNPSPMPSGFQPLKGAEKEALDVAQLLRTEPLIGSQATELAVLQQLPNARIIHLATHGTFNEQQPLLGGVALAQTGKDAQNDGLLTAEEIFNLNSEGKLTLNAELLVLSACNTGRGRITGDGVIGLSRSFIAAGIPSVIVSLWSVPDAPTAELMSEFYTNLYQKKLDKAQALRMAMLKMMEKHRDNPRAWAAFTLIGEAQ